MDLIVGIEEHPGRDRRERQDHNEDAEPPRPPSVEADRPEGEGMNRRRRRANPAEQMGEQQKPHDGVLERRLKDQRELDRDGVSVEGREREPLDGLNEALPQ